MGEELTRHVQLELYKRQLFHNEVNGETTPALISAIKRYQERKGFEPTGLIDSEVLASLGIPETAGGTNGGTVVFSAASGQRMYGPHGDLLAEANTRENENLQSQAGSLTYASVGGALGHLPPLHRLADSADHSASFVGRSDEAGAPVEISFELTNDWIQSPRGARTRRTQFSLQPSVESDWNITALDQKPEKGFATSSRRSARSRHPTRQREEPNPIVLAYNTVGRMLRTLFDDTPATKQPASKRRLSAKRDRERMSDRRAGGVTARL